jgi:ABC transport system ATP-binding/permease protein
MNAFSLTDVSLTLVNEPVFEEVTLGIDEGEKIGLVGRNGSGKTTFLRLLRGELEPGTGSVSRNKTVTVSSLEQRPEFRPDMTLKEFYQFGDGPLIELAREYEQCLHAVHDGPGADERLSVLTERMEREGGFTSEQAYLSSCRELGLLDTAAAMETFSGGMVRRAALARTLASGASFFTFDEPTNHLDLDSIEWLEQKMKEGREGFVLVTHDRSFLDAVCSSIIEIDGSKLYKYEGNYSVYLEKKATRREIEAKAEQKRTVILRRELEWLKRGPKARTGKDKGRKDRIHDLLETEVQHEAAAREFSSSHCRLGKKVLELEGISKAYDGRRVVQPFSYSFKQGERIGVIGPNGSGKSTFLDMIAGRLPPDTGAVSPGINTSFAYLDQTGEENDKSQTVLDFITSVAERIPAGEGGSVSAEQFLESFLFPRPMFSQPLRTLSGGEFRRLSLIRVLASSPNFLLLDEPTNDLDIETIRQLENYLLDFKGCILLVSHDRSLLDRITDYLFIFNGSGGIRGFLGDYRQYREMLGEEREEAAGHTAGRGNSGREEKPKRKKTGLTFKEQQEHDALLDEISSLEEEKNRLEEWFSGGTHDLKEMERNTLRHKELEVLIETKTDRWVQLAEQA